MGDPGTERKLAEFAARVAPRAAQATAPLERAAAGLFDAFAEGGVTPLLLKGAGLARLLYTEAEHRPYSDVDLLVAPAQWDPARRILGDLRYHNASQMLGIDDVGSVVHEETWLAAPDSGQHDTLVELHRWLPGAQAAPEATWAALSTHAEWIEVEGGGRVRVLDPAGQAMHLSLHVAQHGPGFARGLNELALGLERWPVPVWRSAAVLAEAIGATDWFAGGLWLLANGREMARVLELRATDRTIWEIANRDQRPRGTFHLDALLDAPGLVDRLLVARRALLPGADWILAQYPWARRHRGKLLVAYGRHLLAAPLWALQAMSFRRRARRARL